MNVSAPFIRRKVMTTLLMVGITAVGMLGYRSLPVSDLPDVDFPTISVTARMPGANPETMASAIATPLEKQFSSVPGLEGMSSVSGFGVTQITLQFSLDRNIDGAALDVQSAISRTQGLLPPDMPAPPSFQKVNPADLPIMLLTITSETLPMYKLDEYAQTTMAQRLSMVSGVAQVNVYGSQKYAVRIQADPELLAARSVGIDQVAESVRQANSNLPTGVLQGKQQAFTIRSTAQLTDAAAYRQVIVAYRNGSPVRVGELGKVVDSIENEEVAAWWVSPGPDGKPLDPRRSIMLGIQKQPGANTVAVANAIKELLPAFREQLPPSVGLHILIDRSVPIRDSIHDVEVTLVLAFLLVVLVIFIFLRNIRATLIPTLALPVSLIATFGVMYLLNYSLDNMSLLALTLAVGFVVDDAIVMLENIVRHLDMGKDRLRAALDGSAEVGFTIVSMTVSLVAVFIPVLLMSGIVGRLLREFAVTISVAIILSGVVSITLTPMLCALMLKPERRARHGWLYRLSEYGFRLMTRAYDVTLRASLRIKFLMLLLTLAMIAGTGYYLMILPKGFLPNEDTGFIYGNTEGAQGISFEALVAAQAQVAEIIRNDENVEAFSSSVGISGPTLTGNAGRLFIRLKPRDQRSLSAEEVAARLRRKVAGVPGLRTYFQVPPPIRLERRISKSPYQITLSGPDTDELYRSAQQLESRMREMSDLRDVTTDLMLNSPQVTVRIDRDRATRLGVNARSIEDALANAYGARQITTIFTPNNEYQVILELAPQYRREPKALSLLYVRGEDHLVPFDSLVKLEPGIGPLQVNHTGQLPSVTISFALRPGASLGDNLALIESVARDTLPPTVATSFQGTAQAFQASAKGLGLLLIAAVVVIYLIMGMLYESFVHPVTILSGLPSAGIGALVTLQLFNSELNMYSAVGLILLIGIVKKNAIMMVDFALDAERTAGKTAAEAIHEAALVRFRPIMMTTMAALLGALPIAMGLGAGAESRRPLGLAVIGGLIVSQFLTLYVTPVIYIYLDKLRPKRRTVATPVETANGEFVGLNGPVEVEANGKVHDRQQPARASSAEEQV